MLSFQQIKRPRKYQIILPKCNPTFHLSMHYMCQTTDIREINYLSDNIAQTLAMGMHLWNIFLLYNQPNTFFNVQYTAVDWNQRFVSFCKGNKQNRVQKSETALSNSSRFFFSKTQSKLTIIYPFGYLFWWD